MLYLPALFFHQVSQREDEEGKVIAVNFWFDMSFDVRFNYFTFVSELISKMDPEETKRNVPQDNSDDSEEEDDKEQQKSL